MANGTKLLHIELACFREKMANRMPWDQGGVTPAWHFKAVALALWPEDGPEGTPRFIWHRWADEMLQAACHEPAIWQSPVLAEQARRSSLRSG